MIRFLSNAYCLLRALPSEFKNWKQIFEDILVTRKEKSLVSVLGGLR